MDIRNGVGDAIEGLHQEGSPLRGSTVPMARMYGGSESSRATGGRSGVSPLWITWTRAGSTRNEATTSSAMAWETTWTDAP